MSEEVRIYLDLDAFLDTRLGTLALHDPKLPAQLLANGYRDRIIDEFPGLTREEFMKLYARRGIGTLQASVATNIFALLHNVAHEQLNSTADGGPVDNIIFVVNAYPYELTQEEMEQLCSIIQYRALDTFPVEMVRISDEDLTVEHCKKNYAIMVRYQFDYWIDMHAKEFETTRMPEVTVIAPALFVKMPPKELLDPDAHQHPLRQAEITLAPALALRYVDASLFSIDDVIQARV